MSLRSYLRQSIAGFRVQSEQMRQIEPEKIHFSDVVGIFIRGWPYINPMFYHAIAFISIAVFQLLWEAFWGFMILGMIYNNVILNEAVGMIPASILFLDPDTWVHVESLTNDQRFALVPMVVMLAVVSGTLGAVIDNANNYYRVWVMQNINQNLRLHLMSQLNHLSLKFHAESKAGDAIYRLFQDSAMVTQVIQALAIDPFLMIMRFLIGLAVVFAFSPSLALVVVFTWVPMVILANKMSVKLRFGFKEARERNAALTSNIQESIDGIRTIKVNGLEAEHQQRFEQRSVDAFHAAHDARVRLLLFSFFAFLCAAIPLAFIELTAAYFAYIEAEVFLKNILIGFAFAAWNLGSQDQFRARAREGVNSVQNLLTLWGRAQDMAMGLNRVYQILDLTPEIEDIPRAQRLPDIRSNIEFNHVQFSYPEREVFKDLHFTANSGEITAIMGPTGSGKSTLMLLLLRMFEFQKGDIRVNNRSIRAYHYQDVRDQVTLATQENILFSMTVKENIRYSRPEATDDEVMEAARIACADTFIERLPDGYDTYLGEKSTKLSTGQRQRLVIARAIVKNTPILILDEPTASLDAVTERRIMTNIKEWAANRTVFLVTHRLSTIREADRIVFIQDGIVADFGSHEELIQKEGGGYKSFVDAELAATNRMAAG